MPTYDYQCKTCGHRFEYFQSITSDALRQCPAELCAREGDERGHGEVVRLVSGGAGLVFKGEGFYLTDYARKGGESGGRSATSTSGSSKAGETKSAQDTGGASTGGESKGSESKGSESKTGGSSKSDSGGGAS